MVVHVRRLAAGYRQKRSLAWQTIVTLISAQLFTNTKTDQTLYVGVFTNINGNIKMVL